MAAEGLFDILDAWDLLREGNDLARYSMRDWQRIEEALIRMSPAKPAVGAVHLGLTDGIQVSEGVEPLARVTPHALMFETVWLPDPAYSFLSHDAAKAFALLPEGQGTFFDSKPGPQLHWRNLWSMKPVDRRGHAATQLGPILQRLRALRPLADLGAVRFFRWEPLLLAKREEMRTVALALANDSDVKKLTQRLPQAEYALGARAGRIGMVAAADFTGPGPGPKKGEQMFWANKLPMVLSALLNASVSTSLSSSFDPSARGDRLLYDCFVSGGHVEAVPKSLVSSLRLPRFAEAVEADVISIRRDSEALGIFREALRDAAGVTEDAALPAIEARLREAAARLGEDASLWKAVGSQSVDGAITSLVTGLATYVLDPTTGATEGGRAAVVAAVVFLSTLLRPVLGGASDRGAKRERAELVMRVVDKI